MMETKNRFQICDEIDTKELAKVIENCLKAEPEEIVVIQTSNPSSLNRAVRAAAMVSQMERLLPLVLRFTGPPTDGEDIWVSMAIECIPEGDVSEMKSLHVSTKSSVSALAVAITNIVHDGEAARLVGIGPENVYKMAKAIAIAANHCSNPAIGPVGELMCRASTVVLDPTTNTVPTQHSLKTAEGLVTFDEQLEEVVGSGLDKNSFKAIMEALAKLFRSLPPSEASTARQDFVDFDGLRRLFSTYVLIVAEETTEEAMVANLTTVFFPFLEPIVLGCRDARALVDESGLLKTSSELCKFAIATSTGESAVCRGIRLMVTGCDNAKWTVLKTGLLDHILDLLRRQAVDEESEPDLQVLLCVKALIIDDDKLAKNPAHVWARELCCDENHMTNTRVVLRRLKDVGNSQTAEVLALFLREFSNTTDNAKILANPDGDNFLAWAVGVLHNGFKEGNPGSELLKTMRMTSSFVRQVAFIDDLKPVVCEVLVSKMLLPLMADWIGRLHDEDTTEKDANDVIKSGIADNVFGIIANITMRQPDIVERLNEAFDMPSLIKLSIAAYCKKSARTEKQILQVLNNFLRSPVGRSKCIDAALLDDVAWHWASDWEKMRIFDKKSTKSIGWGEVSDLARRILIESRHESTMVDGS
ncbi:hypothetical protein Pmar_PMAR020165 [Perkinsus marinus ATCC 50983]|uniref:Uncharacterized protein n=1 Tax=Perkinsus marinus (strain ATCC 50983 / TXsc) TaxID=423536 RepID=C5LPU1_PERM5|nr:hypothetical protein Pmar_PMAR020165 [Perkinsus marinus ATCC 50983]EER01259.1 hypothetical protein Pmar_PMAR020165 [Perkinsus marinus ATCC 50983]|eukprot:XP_002768541.1 hypothetical protein Pmar_PMAR020165 [Perkinsus marinus ATCC 50983]